MVAVSSSSKRPHFVYIPDLPTQLLLMPVPPSGACDSFAQVQPPSELGAHVSCNQPWPAPPSLLTCPLVAALSADEPDAAPLPCWLVVACKEGETGHAAQLASVCGEH